MVAVFLLLIATQPFAAQADPLPASADEATEADTPPAAENGSPPATPAPSTIDPATPAGELATTLTSLQAQAEVSSELSADERTAVADQLAAARAALESITQLQQQAAVLEDELSTSVAEVDDLEAKLSEPFAVPPLPEAETILEWEAALATAEVDLGQATLELRKLTAEIAARKERRQQIPKLLDGLLRQAAEIEGQLDGPQADLLGRIEQATLRARQLQLDAEIVLLRQEARTYESTTRLLSLRKDVAARDRQRAEESAQQIRQRLLALRESVATDRIAELQRQAEAAPRELADLAAGNVALGRANLAIVEELDTAIEKIAQGEALRARLVRTFTQLEKRVGDARGDSAVGSLLRKYRSTLTEARIEANELLEWTERPVDDAELDGLDGLAGSPTNNDTRRSVSIESAIATLRERLDRFEEAKTELLLAQPGDPARAELLATRRQLLLDLIDNGSKKLDRLTELASLRSSLQSEIDRELQYVIEQTLWVRSAPPMRTDTLAALPAAAAGFFDPAEWGEGIGRFLADLVETPVWMVLAAILLIASIVARNRLMASLKRCCELARKPTTISARPTIVAFAVSLALATMVPGFVWLLGWRLEAANPSNTLVDSIGYALRHVALLAFVLEFVRIVTRPHGLGASHFRWPPAAMASVRQGLWVLIVTALPAVLITLSLRHSNNEAAHFSLGRVAFLVACIAFAYAGWTLFGARSPVMEAARERRDRSVFARLRWVWSLLAIGGPAALAVMAFEGHYYTAQQFAVKGLQTAGAMAIILFLQAMLDRVLLVTYRGLAIRRAKEKRAERAAQAAALGEEDDEPLDVIAAPIDEAETPLTDVSEQNRKLIRILTALAIGVVVLVTWSDVLPALEWIGQKGLYEDQVAIESGLPANPDVDERYVTVLDLLIATLLAALTFVAARNLPGLLEIAVLQRVPLDAGARYAAAAIARYLIATLGVIVTFRVVGVGWSSVQWLVAGVSVGLGFGLQEIFANFVSGLILLFERPIRVGDTVTINEITGSVTRIRIRATTVLDWDNREMILPNKDFVTGNLINWTLSNPNVRVVQTIGIAYGSNTELATELLKGVAEANPKILDEPTPLVVFTEFGDNSLVFELRFYVTGLQAFRTIKHDLNMTINRTFAEADIEISFPQRDLHLRSVSDEVRAAMMPQNIFETT